MSDRFPAIPVPGADPASQQRTLYALKEAVEMLAGLRDSPEALRAFGALMSRDGALPFLTDAPSDGNQYARQDGVWQQVVSAAPGISDAPADGKQYVRVNGVWQLQEEGIQFGLSNRTSTLTTGEALIAPWPFTVALDEVFIGVSTVSSSGTVRADMRVAGTSIFSAMPEIAVGQNTNLQTGGVASVLTTAPLTITKGTMVSFFIDAAGTGAKELVLTCNGRRA